MELVLRKVDARGRVNLENIVAPGVEFYVADAQDDGTILLKPVTVASTTAKRPAEQAAPVDPTAGDPPWDTLPA